MPLPLIHAENLSLIRGQRLLFQRLTFTLQRGQAIHLSGGNGSGKTSLFKVLLGLLSADSGTLQVLGKSVADVERDDYRQLLYLGHQTAIKHELTVLENLRLNSLLFDEVKATEAQLKHALSAVGLAGFHEQLVGKLSAGQKRRVMLARLWLTVSESKTEKALWLLDEPLAALDVEMIGRLQGLIDQHLSLGGAVIFTSHQSLSLSNSPQSLYLGEPLAANLAANSRGVL